MTATVCELAYVSLSFKWADREPGFFANYLKSHLIKLLQNKRIIENLENFIMIKWANDTRLSIPLSYPFSDPQSFQTFLRSCSESGKINQAWIPLAARGFPDKRLLVRHQKLQLWLYMVVHRAHCYNFLRSSLVLITKDFFFGISIANLFQASQITATIFTFIYKQ